ncbi:hypothetical protein FIBSPDRAFT_817531 [Athelia psychrophila]|uniref:Acid proteinase n=1 Tax=Athelia psychrophila TaxID=1759441 RepID=A0A166RHQ3_9AGAM|nr:hypothetical protein FIBSPDRAFT_817531 [Fibularhizoctonia sp. CBS 109695]
MVAIQLLAGALFASAALATPSNSRLGARLERRRDGRQSQPPSKLPTPSTSNNTQDTYTSNWAGAVWESYPSGTFTSVTGTFTVPTPTGNDGSASAWVGIDGDTCGSAILQTGVDFTVSGGAVSYDAWYEWFPAGAYDFSGISFSAGDSVTVTVTASSTTAGTAVIENNTNGQTVTQDLSSTSALCQENAEWIVEDYDDQNGMVPFANFGQVTFTGASAGTVSSGNIGPDGATIFDIDQNNVVLTSTTTSSDGVVITYQ